MHSAWLVILGVAVPAVASAEPALATPGELFMIATDSGAARCERWAVAPGVGGQGQLSRPITIAGEAGTETIDYLAAGAALTLTGRARSAGDQMSTSCALTFHVEAQDRALAVDAGRWFFTADGCAQALAARQRVAIDLSACALDPMVAPRDEAAAARTFERLLARGGLAYSADDGRCTPVHVTPARPRDRTTLRGYLWTRVTQDGVRGRSGYDYELVPGERELTLLGPSATYDDGSGYGMGCGSELPLAFSRDVVHANGDLFLTRAACRTAIAAERLRDAWLPPLPDDQRGDADAAVASAGSTGIGGGC